MKEITEIFEDAKDTLYEQRNEQDEDHESIRVEICSEEPLKQEKSIQQTPFLKQSSNPANSELSDACAFPVNRSIQSSKCANTKELCSDSVRAETLPEVLSENDKCGEELNYQEGLSCAENVSKEQEQEQELDFFLPTTVYALEKEEAEGKQKEVEIVMNGEGEPDDVPAEAEIQSINEMELNKESGIKSLPKCFLLDANDANGNESGTEEDQNTFMKELETFHRERCLDFKPPKFYQEPLNCLKLWRAVIRLGGYEQVTSLKLWRQVGESFRPPKTCTTVSWTFRGFYEKALLEYEKYKMRCGELPFNDASLSDPVSGDQVNLVHASGSGRARRDAAARAMQGWHSQRLFGNGEVGDPIIKDKNLVTTPKREKQLRNIGFLKRKGSSLTEHTSKFAHLASKSQLEIMVLDVGMPADWVKIHVRRMKDCYEVYALVPGLLREEVHVQSDPVGRLVISGQPEQQDNPWGVTPFRKVVSLPTRIDPHQTSAVVTLHGQLFVRVPFDQSELYG